MKSRFLGFIKKNSKKIVKVISIVVLLGVLTWLTFQLWPFISSLNDEASREAFKENIHRQGILGWFTVLGIQVLQVVVAIIPGEPIEVLSGIIYGAFGGLFTCLAGVLIGTMLIFYAVRWLGASLVAAFVESEKLQKFKFLQNVKRLELITFILFFIPGTPKDILTYFAGLTPIKPLRFFVISTFARIPSIVTSTIVGNNLSEGRFWESAIIFAATAAVAGIGIVVNNIIMKKINEKEKLKEERQALQPPADKEEKQ